GHEQQLACRVDRPAANPLRIPGPADLDAAVVWTGIDEARLADGPAFGDDRVGEPAPGAALFDLPVDHGSEALMIELRVRAVLERLHRIADGLGEIGLVALVQ